MDEAFLLDSSYVHAHRLNVYGPINSNENKFIDIRHNRYDAKQIVAIGTFAILVAPQNNHCSNNVFVMHAEGLCMMPVLT